MNHIYGIKMDEFRLIKKSWFFYSTVKSKSVFSFQLQLHSNLDSFFKVIPKEIVPKDYGGDQLSLKEMHGESGTVIIS